MHFTINLQHRCQWCQENNAKKNSIRTLSTAFIAFHDLHLETRDISPIWKMLPVKSELERFEYEVADAIEYYLLWFHMIGVSA